MTKLQKVKSEYGGPLFSHGNTKLPSSTAIFNMGAASNGQKGDAFQMLCAGFLSGQCQLCSPESDCYTVAAERQYVDVRNMRLRTGEFWARCNTAEFVEAFNTHRTKSTRALRLNEAAEISNEAEAVKVCEIAATLDVPVYIYTTRKDLMPLLTLLAPDNLCVNGSGFMADNEYRAVPKADIAHTLATLRAQGQRALECPGSCKSCRVCVKRHGVVILSKIELN